MEDEPVTIVDRDVLKVLSVDTRMDILKILSEGGRPPSFVAKKLNKSDATIVEHLEKLERVGLVKKLEAPGKKFIFYSLTERGVGIMSSKSRRLVIVLATSLVVMFLGVGSFVGHLYMSMGGGLIAQRAFETTIGAGESVPIDDAMIIVTKEQFLLYAAIILIAIAAAGFSFYFYRKSKSRVSYEA